MPEFLHLMSEDLVVNILISLPASLPFIAWAAMPLERGPKGRNYGLEILYRQISREPVF